VIEAELALARAAVRQAVLEDDVAEQVTFCFSGHARQAGPADRLMLLGPDVDTSAEAIAVDLFVDDRRCLLARFPPATPVNLYSVAVALDGAARDVRSASVMSTAPLSTSPQMAVVAGGTTAPDLVSVKLQPTRDRMTLTFDEQLDKSVRRRPQAFSYYSLNGRLHAGDDVESVDSDTVIVAFTSPDDDVGDAIRIAVADGAVQGRDGSRSTPAARDVRAEERTAAPDLVQVERVPGSDVLWDFRFDEAVEEPVPERFALYAEDASPSFATAVTRPSPTVVRAVVPGVDDATAEQVLAVAEPGAVRDIGAATTLSTLGTIAIGNFDVRPGRTTGPDLLSATIDTHGGLLTLEFDEALEDDVRPSPSSVRLVLPGGDRVAARSVVEITGNRAIFLVPGTVARATKRVVVEPGAVRGRDGEASAPGSVLPS
jgi:hypothetical protein